MEDNTSHYSRLKDRVLNKKQELVQTTQEYKKSLEKRIEELEIEKTQTQIDVSDIVDKLSELSIKQKELSESQKNICNEVHSLSQSERFDQILDHYSESQIEPILSSITKDVEDLKQLVNESTVQQRQSRCRSTDIKKRS